MAYVGFDLDETLGRFSVLHPYTMFLQPHTVMYQGVWSGIYGTTKYKEPIPLSAALEEKVNQAFKIFLDCLIEKEKVRPSGLLRPGIVDIAKRLYALQHTTPQAVKGVCIYSNNGNLALLQIAGKMIEKLANAPNLFCNYVHWFHPLRRYEIEFGHAGAGAKTTRVLQQIFQLCFPGDPIPVERLYFFDDLIHYNLQSNLVSRYFQVPAYKFDADPAPLDECFKTAMEATNLVNDPEYFQYISLLRLTSMEAIQQYIQRDLKSIPQKANIPNNTSFRDRFNRTFPKPSTTKANFSKALQTFRTLEKKLNIGSVLTNQEKNLYTQAKSILTNYEAENPVMEGGKHRKPKNRSKTQKRRRHN